MTTDLSSIKNILLVEGDPREAQLTFATLEERGLANKLAIVDNGAEALDYLYRRGKYETRPGGNPIFVLLDLALAEVHRLEVLEVIKADDYLKLIPVVVLSHSHEMPELPGVLASRVNACVPKPVDLAEFMKSIEALGPFWDAVDEPAPPVSGNARSSDPIYEKGRTPNRHGKNFRLKVRAMKNTAALQCEKSLDPDFQPQTNRLPRILLADDEEALRRRIADSLIEFGYDVDAAEDGAVAWEALQANRYDLLITDNSMPKITGVSLVKMLRDRDPALPVVMISGLKPSDDPNWHASLGISAFLLKPFDLGALRDTVEHVLRVAVPAAV